jgi:hypothetical protein
MIKSCAFEMHSFLLGQGNDVFASAKRRIETCPYKTMERCGQRPLQIFHS